MAEPPASGGGRLIAPADAFSPSYARARVQFLEAAATAGMAISSHNHPLPGRDGEMLAMDVALDGDPAAERLLIVSSACHGVEGYCGSGVQVFAAHDAEWREHARAAGVAVLYIHALNPHGFSWVRRVTHENVDLNRNFQDFSQPLPVNEAYAELHALLLPGQWPPGADNAAAIGAYIQTHGLNRFQAAVSQGQHAFADGLFYGGVEPTWSNHTLREVLRRHGRQARHLAWIDLHTGLGESGLGERICACRDDAVALARARAWWGGDGQTPGDFHLRRLVHLGLVDRPDVERRVRGMPAGAVHRHRHGIRHGADRRGDRRPSGGPLVAGCIRMRPRLCAPRSRRACWRRFLWTRMSGRLAWWCRRARPCFRR